MSPQLPERHEGVSPEPSPGQSRLLEETIGEAMDDLAQRNEARARRESIRVRSTRERVARIALTVALPALVAALVWNVSSVSLVAARYIGPWLEREEAEAALKAVVDDIQAFDADYGEVPASLAEVGLPTSGEWTYTRLDNKRYRLAVSIGGQAITVEGP